MARSDQASSGEEERVGRRNSLSLSLVCSRARERESEGKGEEEKGKKRGRKLSSPHVHARRQERDLREALLATKAIFIARRCKEREKVRESNRRRGERGGKREMRREGE